LAFRLARKQFNIGFEMILNVRFWKRIVALAAIGFALLYAIEVGTSIIRGYGFFWEVERTRLIEPVWVPYKELSYVSRYAGNYWRSSQTSELWPPPEEITKNVSSLRVSKEQPYSRFGIWIFESVSQDLKYLYSPLSTTDYTTYTTQVEQRMCETIVCCDIAKRERPKGNYHPYKEYPPFVLDKFGGEKWVCLVKNQAVDMVKSEVPPIPGAIVVYDSNVKPKEIYYPRAVLPALRSIYPDVKIPEERILQDSETSR
jgi:hypothetical protein